MPDVVDRVSDGLGGDKLTVDEKADSEDGKREILAAGQGTFSVIKQLSQASDVLVCYNSGDIIEKTILICTRR